MERNTKQRQAGLDGLRGLAALLVFGVHLWIYQLPNSVQVTRDNFGEFLLFESRVAFVMFFVLSGYLLYRPFARAALGEAKPASIVAYFVRRATRILPAYYVALAGAVTLLATAGDVPGKRAVESGDLPRFALFVQNYTPHTLLKLNAATWTLVIEVAFYILLPLVALFALKCCYGSLRGQLALIASLVTAGLAWNVAGWAAGWGTVASHSPPSFLPYFAFGMLVALGVEGIRSGRLRPFGSRATFGLLAGAVAVLVVNGYWHASDARPDGFMIKLLADIPAGVAFAAVIAAMVAGTGAGLGWLGRAPLAWFGQISYGFYLWHIPMILWARGHGLLGGGTLLDLAVMLPLAAGAGALSWYALERPLMNRAARLRRDADPERSAADSPAHPHRSQARTIALANPRP